MSEPMPIWFCLKCGCVAMDWGNRENPFRNYGATVSNSDGIAMGFLCKPCFARADETGELRVADPAMN